MAKSKRPVCSVAGQKLLEHLHVRPVTTAEESARLDQLLVDHHYLHDATLVGEHLRYVATYRGEWLAVATWSGAAFHLKARDEFIGWTFEQCRRRRALLANNARLLVLPGSQLPNRSSRAVKSGSFSMTSPTLLSVLCGSFRTRSISSRTPAQDPRLGIPQIIASIVAGWAGIGFRGSGTGGPCAAILSAATP